MKRFVVIALIVAALGVLVWQFQSPPSGVEPIAWNQATCSHCEMHVGDKRFAAQLQTKEGDVHNFDDYGCLFEFIVEEAPAIRQTYFHHYREDRWFDHKEVGFVEIDEPTPMGYGLGAVDKHQVSDAMGFDEASSYVVTGEFERADSKSKHKHGQGGPP